MGERQGAWSGPPGRLDDLPAQPTEISEVVTIVIIAGQQKKKQCDETACT